MNRDIIQFNTIIYIIIHNKPFNLCYTFACLSKPSKLQIMRIILFERRALKMPKIKNQPKKKIEIDFPKSIAAQYTFVLYSVTVIESTSSGNVEWRKIQWEKFKTLNIIDVSWRCFY